MSESHAWLGIKACGCLDFAAVDEPSLSAENGSDALRVLRAGGDVEWLPLEEMKAKITIMPGACATCKRGQDHV